MKKCVLTFAIIAVVLQSCESRGVNGGLSCAVCTVLMGIVTQLAQLHEESIIDATVRLCSKLNGTAEMVCLDVAYLLEPLVLEQEVTGVLTPDVLCNVFGTCSTDDGHFCHLFPLPFSEAQTTHMMEKMKQKEKYENFKKVDVCSFPVIREICDALNNSFNIMTPAQDNDGDGFSLISAARGSNWSGKDCNDFDSNIYPGRIPSGADHLLDTNCNGIFGINVQTNQTWEEELCTNSSPRGLIYVSDSVGAHFHMPEVWMDPTQFAMPWPSEADIILDEFDWPQYGFATGFKNITSNIFIEGSVDSLYLQLRARNLCNHRDYQNLSKNGASTMSWVSHEDLIKRNQSRDQPAVVVFAMDGNDVCNNFKDTVANMTSPREFRKNVLETLRAFDEKLPSSSHVILIGLVDASFIYTAMADRLHPLGNLYKNIYYKDMYRWFNCMQIGPCTGWLNSNSTLRKLTSQRAHKLSTVLKNLVQHETFEHFQLHYLENPINSVMRKYNLSIANLIEAADSFHPNQLAQPLIANELWNDILHSLPSDVIGPVNPNNERIREIFGDQGGY